MKPESTTQYSAEHAAFLKHLKSRERFVTIARYALLVILICLWELFSRIGVIDPFIGSSPVRVAQTIARLYAGGQLFLHIGITLYETVVGFILGTAIGTIIAILLWWSTTLSRILDP